MFVPLREVNPSQVHYSKCTGFHIFFLTATCVSVVIILAVIQWYGSKTVFPFLGQAQWLRSDLNPSVNFSATALTFADYGC